MAIASRMPQLVNVAWTIALSCVVTSGYVLSYAPVVRVIKATQTDDQIGHVFPFRRSLILSHGGNLTRQITPP